MLVTSLKIIHDASALEATVIFNRLIEEEILQQTKEMWKAFGVSIVEKKMIVTND